MACHLFERANRYRLRDVYGFDQRLPRKSQSGPYICREARNCDTSGNESTASRTKWIYFREGEVERGGLILHLICFLRLLRSVYFSFSSIHLLDDVNSYLILACAGQVDNCRITSLLCRVIRRLIRPRLIDPIIPSGRFNFLAGPPELTARMPCVNPVNALFVASVLRY